MASVSKVPSRCGRGHVTVWVAYRFGTITVNELFRDGIVDAYFDRVPIPDGSDGQPQAELADKIGIAPSNYSRWRKGQIPRGDKFVLLAAALDARLPRGARAALLGFCKAFDGIQARLGKPSVPLTGSQALCLWAVFRTRAWWEAAQTGQARHFKIASRDVSDRMREYRPQTRIVPVTRIQAMIKDHCRLGAYWSWS